MSTPQTKHQIARAAALGVAGNRHTGLDMSDVEWIHPAKLYPHPLNGKLFRQEDAQYFERLREDVQKRGILVPLIAREDGTLLAGHNRLQVATELGLQSVPVQYVVQRLTVEQEQEFLVKDNLFRRHLSQVEWIDLYRVLFPQFDERVEKKVAGRKKNEIPHERGIFDEPTTEPLPPAPLTAREIARTTGQSERTVQQHLQRHRKTRESEADETADAEQEQPPSDGTEEMIAAVDAAFRKIRKQFDAWLESNPRAVAARLPEVILRVEHQQHSILKSFSSVKKHLKNNLSAAE